MIITAVNWVSQNFIQTIVDSVIRNIRYSRYHRIAQIWGKTLLIPLHEFGVSQYWPCLFKVTIIVYMWRHSPA